MTSFLLVINLFTEGVQLLLEKGWGVCISIHKETSSDLTGIVSEAEQSGLIAKPEYIIPFYMVH